MNILQDRLKLLQEIESYVDDTPVHLYERLYEFDMQILEQIELHGFIEEQINGR